jgi:2-succinyl-6-hydroxy-2,4-cyclohexadiene-1-carboxylate synthase
MARGQRGAGSSAYRLIDRLMRLNDLDFHVEVDGHGPALLLLHGFSGNIRAWDAVRPELAKFTQVIAIDLIGHGCSTAPVDADRYTFAWACRDLVALLDALELPSVDLLGYSMGGRLALHLAVQAPERISRLLLESASPGIEHDDARRQRIDSDARLAERIERDGIAAFVAEWEQLPLLQPAPHVSAAARQEHHAQRLRNKPLGLANSLRGMGAGQQTPLWSRLAQVNQPVHLIVGADDVRYREIAERMHAVLPRAELAVVPDAGHTVHVDQPVRFVTLVQATRCR